MTEKVQTNKYFMLVKRSGFSSDNQLISATEGARRLLEQKMWPLWKRTPCKKAVGAGSQILIYLSGSESDCRQIIASAVVDNVTEWSDRLHRKGYPLLLEGEPEKVLVLKEVAFFDQPIHMNHHLDDLSFIPKNKQKWGVAMMSGMRPITAQDYELLISAAHNKASNRLSA